MSHISIDLESKVATFEQIKGSIIRLIGVSDLAPGHKLPPIRQLAGDLGVAPNTVARAYRELEADGFVRSRGRRGTTVVGMPPRAPTADTLTAAVRDARTRGMAPGDILATVAAALAASN